MIDDRLLMVKQLAKDLEKFCDPKAIYSGLSTRELANHLMDRMEEAIILEAEKRNEIALEQHYSETPKS